MVTGVCVWGLEVLSELYISVACVFDRCQRDNAKNLMESDDRHHENLYRRLQLPSSCLASLDASVPIVEVIPWRC